MTEKETSAEIANMARHAAQDLLESYELNDGSYANEYVPDNILDTIESLICAQLENEFSSRD